MNNCTAVYFVCAALMAVGSASVVTHPRQKIGNLVLIGQTLNKFFYKGSNVESFEAASNDCKEIGGYLATITSSEDLPAIRKVLEGQVVGKVWMGLVVKDSEACRKTQLFTANCWQWETTPAPAPDYHIMWNAEARNRVQIHQVSKGYLDLVADHLDFDGNTSSHPFICELTFN